MEVVTIEAGRLGEAEYGAELCRHLERGDILMALGAPFVPAGEDADFLRAQKQSGSATHKNIAYKPHLQKTTGVEARSEADAARLHAILSRYSEGALEYLARLLPRYAQEWRVDYASFRGEEEAGRPLPLKHRNDLMHVDAFPTRPTHGGRILRAFSNLHPTRERIWVTSDSFEEIAERYAEAAGLMRVTTPLAAARRTLGKAAHLLPDRSPYDEFMLEFHHFLKANAEFQEKGGAHTWAFPPGATWISFTDQIAHKVTTGQYALEQTCIVPYSAMLLPELSPLAVLERIAGRKLVAAA
jgi:hypothetical protein